MTAWNRRMDDKKRNKERNAEKRRQAGRRRMSIKETVGQGSAVPGSVCDETRREMAQAPRGGRQSLTGFQDLEETKLPAYEVVSTPALQQKRTGPRPSACTWKQETTATEQTRRKERTRKGARHEPTMETCLHVAGPQPPRACSALKASSVVVFGRDRLG